MGEKEPTPRTGTAGPPTQLMAAWTGLPRKDQRRVQLAGFVLGSFTVGIPVAASVVLAVLERAALPLIVWAFSGLFGVVAVAMIWPPLGVWAVSSAAPAIGKLFPVGRLAGLLNRQERRAPREED